MVTLKRLFTGFFTASRFRMTEYFRMVGGFGCLFAGRHAGRPLQFSFSRAVGAIHESPVSLPGRLFSYTRYSPVISPPVMKLS